MPHFSRQHRIAEQQSRAALQWPSLVMAAVFFIVLDHGSAVVDSDQWGSGNGYPQLPYYYYPPFPYYYYYPGKFGGPGPPETGTNSPPSPPSDAAPAPPSAPAPPGSEVPGSNTSPGPPIGGNNGDRQQQPGERQKPKTSNPKVAATVGWVFLAAAALLQVVLGGFLAYKRWELGRYWVRLEAVPADAGPPSFHRIW